MFQLNNLSMTVFVLEQSKNLTRIFAFNSDLVEIASLCFLSIPKPHFVLVHSLNSSFNLVNLKQRIRSKKKKSLSIPIRFSFQLHNRNHKIIQKEKPLIPKPHVSLITNLPKPNRSPFPITTTKKDQINQMFPLKLIIAPKCFFSCLSTT